MDNFRRGFASLGALAFFVAALVIVPARPALALAGTTAVVPGYNAACVVEASGPTYCWGKNDHGQFGDTTSVSSSTPTLVSGGRSFTKLASGSGHTCGIVANGDVYCWGSNTNGQIGDNTTLERKAPTLVLGGIAFASIAGGESFTCGLSTGGTAYCWGYNANGQLGDGTTTDRLTPTAVSGGGTYTAITTGRASACAITSGGVSKCWGLNNDGQLGDNTTTNSSTPVTVSGGLTFTSISAGYRHACAIRTTGAAYCWGFGGQGQRGDNTYNQSNIPVAVNGGLTFSSISAGLSGTCAITTSSLGYCWGSNAYGEVGSGDNSGYLVPTATAGGYRWVAINASPISPSVCGTTDGGGVYCWGYNAEGQVGDNSTTNRNAPTAVWLFVGTGSVTVTGIIDPSLTFTVAGRGTVCNGQSGTGFQTGSTSTAVSLGHLTSAAVAGAAQDLTLATNAANGFTVYIRTSGTTPNSFRTSGGATVADVSGTNASPGAAPVAGTAGFGYTSSDASTAFTSNTWAKLTNTDSAVLIGTAGTTSKSRCVGYGVAIAATSTAGSYSSSVVYTAVPSF